CPSCQSETVKKHGNTTDRRPRFRCCDCRRVWVDAKLPKPARRPRRVSDEQVVTVLGLLCEGVSVRAVERLTGLQQRTILRLLVDLGDGCKRLLEERVKDVPVNDVEIDEIWSYIVCKESTKTRKGIENPEAGDSYCFLGIERNTKLILANHVGRRTSADANRFMARLAVATSGHFQVSSDAWDGFPGAVEAHLGGRVDHGAIRKEFGSAGGIDARRYAPPRLLSSEKYWVSGTPDEDRVGTSRIERFNWTLRTGLRRFVRLSNGFSRKRANLDAAVHVFIAYYNF